MKLKHKLLIIGCSFLILLCIPLRGCSTPQTENDTVSKSIFETVQNRENKEFKLQTILQFEWDKFVIVGPYTKISSLKMNSGTRRKLKEIGIEQRDDICVLVFLKEGKTVRIIIESRNLGFCRLPKTIYSADNAIFEILPSTNFTSGFEIADLKLSD